MTPSVRTLSYALILMLILSVMSAPTQHASAQFTANGKLNHVAGQDDTPNVEKPEVVIEAPKSVKVGDMIVIDLSKSIGTGFDMIIIPEPPQVKVFDDGKVVVTATGYKTTEFLVIVACALDGKSDVKTQTIKVVGPQPVVPVNPGENMLGKVQEWCAGVTSPTQRDDAIKLSQSFASLASVIENGTFQTPAEIIAATKTSNRDALGANLEHWIPLLDGLMNELKAMSKAGMLPDAKSHGPVWRSVSEGLKAYAEKLAEK